MKKKKRSACALLAILLCFAMTFPASAGGYVGDITQNGKYYNVGLDGPGDGWNYQDFVNNQKVDLLTLDNCTAEDLFLQAGITIALADGSVNFLNELSLGMDTEAETFTIRGNGMLLVKLDGSLPDAESAVSFYGEKLNIEAPLRMIGGAKEGDTKPLTFRDGQAVTSDGAPAAYVAFVPSGSESRIPAFPASETPRTSPAPQFPERPSLPDNPGNIQWNLSANGTLTVSGSGAMENYDGDIPPWCEEDAEKITKVVIERGVTTVGDGAFAACPNLKSVSLASTVTGIGHEAFCNSPVSDITIPDGVTFIGERAFEGTNVTRVQLSKNVAYIGQQAFSIVGLTSVTANAANPSYSSQDGVLFNKDKSAILTFPSAKEGAYAIPQSVKTIAPYAFAYSEASRITIPSGVTDIGEGAFYNACEITALNIPASVASIGGAFTSYCLSLEAVTVESGNAYYASRDGALFDKAMKTLICYPCNRQASAYAIPSGVSAIGLNDGDGFDGCQNLTALEIPASVTRFAWGALYCENLKDVYYGGNQAQWNALVNSEPNRSTDELEIIQSFRMHYGSALPGNLVSAAPALPTQFSDVPAGAYYADAVQWAVENDVTKGVSETNFAPEDICNRGQVATFLWRAKGCPEPQTTANPFTDVSPTSAFYKAILWAAETGVTAGTSATTFSPGNPCTRAHVVTFLWRAQGKPAAAGDSSLADAFPQGYYTDAVRWADAAGLLGGTGEAFTPSALCPRADIVTYLYRVLEA